MLLLIAAAFLSPALFADDAALRNTANEFLHAYAAADPIMLHALWSAENVKARTAFDIGIASLLRVKCVETAGAYITSISSDHVVRGTAGQWTSLRVGSAMPRFEIRNVEITFKEANGRWRVTKVQTAERVLAEKIAAVSPYAAWQLIADNIDLLDGELANSVGVQAIDVIEGPVPAKAHELVKLEGDLARMLADPEQEALVENAQSGMKSRSGDVAGQLATAQRALQLAEPLGNPDLLARILGTVGRVYERLPESNEKSAAYYERALALEPQVESRLTMAGLLNNYASVKLKQNEHQAALAAFERCEKIFLDIGDTSSIPAIEVGIAVLFQRQGDDALAELHLKKAIALATAPQTLRRRGEALTLLAERYVHTGREKEAAAALDDALAIGKKTDDAIILGEAHRVSAIAHNRKGEYDAAIRDLDEGMKILRAGRRIHYLTISQDVLAETQFQAGFYREAAESGESSAALAIGMDEDSFYVDLKTIAGRSRLKLGDAEGALADFRDAIAVAEAKRGFAAGDASAQELAFEKAAAPYREASALLAGMGRIDEAFAMSERAKGRVLLDTLLSGRRQIDAVMTPDERQQNDRFQNHLAQLNRKLTAENGKPHPDGAALVKLTSTLHDERAEYETFEAALDAAHPRLRQTHGEMPVAGKRDIAQMLDSSSAIVAFQVMDDRTIAFILKRDDIAHVAIPVARQELAKRVGDYVDALARRDLGYQKPARSLYATLLRPLEQSLHGINVLCIIPDGVLWDLPFESLIDGKGKFVVESRTTFYAPSVSVLSEISREKEHSDTPGTLLAVGNPLISQATRRESRSLYRDSTLAPLPHAADEVNALRRLYGSTSHVYIGKNANEAAVKADLGRFRILHFATHAEFNDENPMYAHIVLAQDARDDEDGLLEAWEIMRMNLNADLAVLSACETAKGRVAPGEGIIGFSWALFVAGCPSSVVSHWKVASDSTARLMVDFHKHLLSDRGPFQKAAALRAAKLAMLHAKKWSHPFYWSAFVLVGRG